MDKIKQFLFKNTSTKQTIAKNTAWLFIGEMLGRLLKFAVVIYATRVLGANGWGVFSYALAFVSVFYVFADIGINTFITKEMSKGGPDKYQYLSASFVLKLLLLIFSLVISLLLIPHFGSSILSGKIILALALLNFSDSFREFVLSINRSLEKMEREAFIKILMNAVTTILGIILLTLHSTPLSLAIAYAIGSIVASIVLLFIIAPDIQHIEWKFSPRVLGVIATFSWPFIATIIFSVMIANIDTIMLGQIRSATEVGFYAAAERIVQFMAIIPVFIGTATFPLFSKSESDPLSSSRIFEKIMIVVLAIGIPITVGGLLLHTELMTTVFGNAYANGGIVLAILILSVVIDFANIILMNAIYIKNLQRKFIIATAVGVVINILANIYLIPRYGATGAAVSTVVSQFLIMVVNWYLLKKFFVFSVIPKLGKIVIATIIMAIVIVVCSTIGIHFIFSLLLAMISYIATLYIQHESSVVEIISIITQK